jgi:glutamate carboxypeptidase
MLSDVLQWSSRNTGSWNVEGLASFAPELAAAFEPSGAQARLELLSPIEHVTAQGQKVQIQTGPAVCVSIRPGAERQVAFTGHYDTVFPKESAFQRPVELKPGVWNGPGTADMKGGLRVMIAAIAAYERFAPPENRLGLNVVITPDEEIGNPVSAPLLAALGARAHVGMTYEPALESGGFAAARKGSGNFAVIFKGRSAHAGRAHAEGRSAIRAAAAFVVGLEAGNAQFEGVTFNTGRIDGGGPNNQVPDIAVVRFNIRAADSTGRDWALAHLHAQLDLANRLDGIAAELTGTFARPPKPFNLAQRSLFSFVKETGRDLGLSLGWEDTGGVCEGNNLFAAGCPNIDTLGVRGGAIHSDREFMLADSLYERAALSFLLLMRFGEGRCDPRELRKMMEA